MMSKLLAILATAMLLASCDREEGASAPEQISYETVLTSTLLQVDEPHTQVFRSWQRWENFWAAHPECSNGCVFAPPYVDFDSSMVVAIFWGLEGFGCVDYAERVEAVTRHEDVTVISLREQPQQEVCHAETYAYLFLKLDRTDGNVMFVGAVPQ